MSEAVVILLPYGRAHQKVKGCDLLSPWKLIADLDPLCMLRSHGVDDTRECFVCIKEAVTAGKKVSFEPAFAHMLRKHGVNNSSES